MQLRSGARPAGVPSPGPVVDAFAGLGDLPGLGRVDADVRISQHPLWLAPRLMPAGVVPFPDLREAKWLTVPASPLLQPLTWQMDVRRRPLSERTPCLPAPDAPSQRKRKRAREGEGEGERVGQSLAFADARDGLALAWPDSHNLEEVVAAMARQLLREPVPKGQPGVASPQSPVFLLGGELCRQLGGNALADASRDRVLRAVLRLALPPWEGGGQDSPGGDASGHAGNRVLREFLQGFAEGSGSLLAPADPFNRALVDMASRLAFDPLRVPGQWPSIAGYCRRLGPLKLATQVFLNGALTSPQLCHWLDGLLAPLVRSTEPLAATLDARTRAAHASHLLASLAWMYQLMGRQLPVCIDAFVRMVAAAARHLPEGAEPLGVGLARAFSGVRSERVNVAFLDALNQVGGAGVEWQGRLVRGYLKGACVMDPSHGGLAAELGAYAELIRHAELLKPQVLGQLMFRLAVADGVDGEWDPASESGRWGNRWRVCLFQTALCPQSLQRAALHGLLQAVAYLSDQSVPGFAELALGMRALVDALCPAGHSQRALALDVCALMADPHHLFNATHKVEAASIITLHLGLMLDLPRMCPLPVPFLNRCVDYLVSAEALPGERWGLLVRLVRTTPDSVLAARVVQVRQWLLHGLIAQRRPQPMGPDLLPAEAVHQTVEALQAVYARVLAGARVRRLDEIAALESAALLPQAREALQPVLDTLRRTHLPRWPAGQAGVR